MEAPIRHAAQSTRRRSRKTCQLVHRLDDDLALHVFSFLDAKRLSLVMQTARRFRKIADQLGIEDLAAFATAAVREAENREAFLADAEATLGHSIRVLSGEE